MARWDGPDTLRAYKLEAGLQDANEYDDTTENYPRLTQAQEDLVHEIAIRSPDCLYSPVFALTPSGDGKTFTFGTDGDGNPIVPLGWVQISPVQTAFTGATSVLWQVNVDFLDEGDQIRIPGNRSHTGTLYCRAVLTPPAITASVAPIIQPATARALIAILAARDFGLEGNQNPELAQAMATKWKDKFPRLMQTLRSRFKGGGALMDPARWYLAAPDLGSTS